MELLHRRVIHLRASGKECMEHPRTVPLCYVDPMLTLRQHYLLKKDPFFRMPCACKKDIPDYPGTEEWGPIVWKILHGLAERVGTSRCIDEEVREWKRLLTLTADILPCDVCKKHYKEVLLQQPIAGILKMNAQEASSFIQRWLWSLHNEINVENGKPAVPFTDLAQYSTVDFQDMFWRLEPVMKLAITKSGVGYISWLKWSASAKMLASFY